MGVDIMKARPELRYFEDPTLDGISIDLADKYYPGIDVDHSSGVYNRAYFLLSNMDGIHVPRLKFLPMPTKTIGCLLPTMKRESAG